MESQHTPPPATRRPLPTTPPPSSSFHPPARSWSPPPNHCRRRAPDRPHQFIAGAAQYWRMLGDATLQLPGRAAEVITHYNHAVTRPVASMSVAAKMMNAHSYYHNGTCCAKFAAWGLLVTGLWAAAVTLLHQVAADPEDYDARLAAGTATVDIVLEPGGTL